MDTNNKPISRLRIALMWLFLAANIVFWIWLWAPARRPVVEQPATGLFESILRFFIGGFFLAAGAVSYVLVWLTSGFTFDFSRPVLPALKPKLFLANIFVLLLQIERRADNRGQTVLGGIRHVILHIALPGGAERQVRLHVEGLWTLGQKRRVMDRLAEQIETWHAHLARAAA